MIKRVIEKWKQYKYRFVPWIALNLKDRSIRAVPSKSSDEVIPKIEALQFLETLFQAFDASEKYDNKKYKVKGHNGQDSSRLYTDKSRISLRNVSVMSDVAGFTIGRKVSGLAHGGTGVFVTSGTVPVHTVVAMYPGTLYYNYEPILLQSINNPFIFRCLDGLLIDGNDQGISKYLYRSCSNRDRVGPYLMCDRSWLSAHPNNPLAIGQYVNNQSKRHSANVAYQEIIVPKDFPFSLKKYIPNLYYSASIDNPEEIRLTRLVVLVSTRTIECGEELFSTYFTVVY
ncbi:hypothetical protein SNE40_004446 [Patella caerulea]|uniref:SET domain-containing protein 9 n=1 Tax=Patella caerulea TaxID=87958 RepID=A0AAN8QCE7_PATCE